MPVPPKRSDQRRRTNSPEPDRVAIDGVVTMPPAEDSWHPAARDWYLSLAQSGQRMYYEPSDWATAQIGAEILTRALEAEKLNGQLLTVWSAIGADLLTTEAARRRARVEVERDHGVRSDPAPAARPKRDPRLLLRAVSDPEGA